MEKKSLELEYKQKENRSKKMLLWFGLVSLVMGFAGWTSAYIVSSKRKDWVSSMELPQAFLWSSIVIILSSLTYIFASKQLKKDELQKTFLALVATFVLALVFVLFQFVGFSQMIQNGYYFTGPTSSIKMSFVFLIAFVHLVHLFAGLISLSIVLFKTFKQKYSSTDKIGFELSATFWHFLGALWIYLILFMYLVN